MNPGATDNGEVYDGGDFDSVGDIASITAAAHTNHAVLITGDQTTAEIAAGEAADAVVIVNDSDLGHAVLVYEDDWSDADDRVTLANLTSLTTAASIGGVDENNFFNIA